MFSELILCSHTYQNKSQVDHLRPYIPMSYLDALPFSGMETLGYVLSFGLGFGIGFILYVYKPVYGEESCQKIS